MHYLTKFPLVLGALLILTLGLAFSLPAAAQGQKPNVLFIVVDDLNDYLGHLGGHPDAITPTMDNLAAEGASFTNAHCVAPVCNPSRIAFLTGNAPWRTGNYHNTDSWGSSEYLKESGAVDMLRHFRQNGYEVVTAGKIFHSKPRNVEESWDEQGGRKGGFFSPKAESWTDPLKGLKNQHARAFHWGAVDWQGLSDIRIADWFVERMKRDYDKPFFMAYGCSRPHIPLTSPSEFVNMFDAEKITLPPLRERELEDLPWMAQQASIAGWQDMEGGYLHNLLDKAVYREFFLNYLAACTYVDAQIGRVLTALEESPYADNTIVALVGDNGWGLGERRHVQKWGLWDDTTRVPFIIKAPGMIQPGVRSDAGVTLMDVFPTLLEMCELDPPVQEFDGQSVVPLLTDPETEWERPAIMTSGSHNFSLRTPHWRYTRWSDGSEELYDHRVDPDELDNVADDPAHEQVKADLARWFPEDAVPSNGGSHQLPITMSNNSKLNFFSLQEGFCEEPLKITAKIGPNITDGTILSHNGNFCGYALYVKDGVLKMTLMDVERPLQWDKLFPEKTTISAPEPLKRGKSYTIEGLILEDKMVLKLDGVEVASAPARLLSIHPAGAMTCGRADDEYIPVGDYEVPFKFEGDIESVTIEPFALSTEEI